jgi:hypothetical protein
MFTPPEWLSAGLCRSGGGWNVHSAVHACRESIIIPAKQEPRVFNALICGGVVAIPVACIAHHSAAAQREAGIYCFSTVLWSILTCFVGVFIPKAVAAFGETQFASLSFGFMAAIRPAPARIS